MQNSISIEQPDPSFLETSRKDIWWIGLFFTTVGLLAFVVYSTWVAFQNEHYQWGFLSLFLLCTVAWIRLVAFFAGISDPQGSIRISAHLILLPKSILPVALSDTIGLRAGRKTSELPWWTVFASVPESAPLFPLPRSCLLRYSQLRCHSLVLFWRWPRRRSWNSGLVWVVFKLFFRFPVQLFAIKNFVQRVLAICRFNLTITQFRTKLI